MEEEKKGDLTLTHKEFSYLHEEGGGWQEKKDHGDRTTLWGRGEKKGGGEATQP